MQHPAGAVPVREVQSMTEAIEILMIFALLGIGVYAAVMTLRKP